MIQVGMLDIHSSSPLKIYGAIDLLANRADLYTGDNFYFGFDSSNHSFLDMIGGHEPLAIKYGQTFSLYKRSHEEFLYDMYLIDEKTKALVPIVHIQAKPSDAALFQALLPMSFTDFYGQVLNEENSLSPGKNIHVSTISTTLEKVVKSIWLVDSEIKQYIEAINYLNENTKCSITANSLTELKALMEKNDSPLSLDDFVATHNPFFDNSHVGISLLLKRNPERITVREVNDNYPRIEILIPGLSEEERYLAVFQKENPGVYKELQFALSSSKDLSKLLIKYFPEKIDQFFSLHQLDFHEHCSLV